MPRVRMPDGAIVDMPDNPTPEQLARLRSLLEPVEPQEQAATQAINDVKAGVGGVLPSATPEQDAAIAKQMALLPAVVSGAARGAARGYDDEIISGLRAALDPNVPGETFADRYRAALGEYRQYQGEAEKGRPVATAAGDIGGAVVASPWGAIGAGKTAAERIAQTMGIGAVEGGLRGSGDREDGRLEGGVKGAGLGAAVGGLFGGALEGAKALGRFGVTNLRALTEGGRRQIFAENLNQSVPEARRQEVINALTEARQIVPGSKPTAGQAVADIPDAAVIAAMQRDLAGKNTVIDQGQGTIAGAFKRRAAEQEAARAAALGEVAGTADDMTAALRARRGGWDATFTPIAEDVVPVDDAARAMLKRPSMEKALAKARELAAETDRALPPDANAFTVRDLQTVKVAMDDMLRNPERFGLGAAEAKAIGGTRDQFVQWLAEKSLAWQEARRGYAQASQPINRMDVAKEIQAAMTDPATRAERVSKLRTAIEKAPTTIKRATGQSRFETLAEVDPALDRVAQALMGDVGRDANFKSLARGVEGLPPGGKFPRLPNILEPGVAMTNRFLSMGGETAQEAINAMAARAALNPGEMAEIMRAVPPVARQNVIDAMMRQMFIAPVAQESTKLFE